MRRGVPPLSNSASGVRFIACSRRQYSASSLDLIEPCPTSALLTFDEVPLRRQHSQLLGDRGRDELVGAVAVLPGNTRLGRFDRTGQFKWERGTRCFSLSSASKGSNISTPKRLGAVPKSRRLKVTSICVTPLTAVCDGGQVQVSSSRHHNNANPNSTNGSKSARLRVANSAPLLIAQAAISASVRVLRIRPVAL